MSTSTHVQRITGISHRSKPAGTAIDKTRSTPPYGEVAIDTKGGSRVIVYIDDVGTARELRAAVESVIKEVFGE